MEVVPPMVEVLQMLCRGLRTAMVVEKADCKAGTVES